jgi:hypothetical protein
MAKTFEFLNAGDTHYDAWIVFENGVKQGAYFISKNKNLTGQQYEDAINSATIKLKALGFTDIEITALMGRQLF